MIRRQVWVAALLLLVGSVWAAANVPAVLTIDVNKSGKAVKNFPHQKHTEMDALKGKCDSCHHGTKAGDTPKACGTCHTQSAAKDAKTGAPGFMSAFHKKCRDCHAAQKERPALKDCKTCHG